MRKRERLAYTESSDEAKFREQFRFAFAGVIIATFFVIPTIDSLMNFLKIFLGLSAILSAIFLVISAARVKYKEPGYMYQALYVTERFRMRMFDWSIDIFGFAFLYFISLLATGLLEKALSVQFSELWTWVTVIGILLIEILIVSIMSRLAKSQESTKKLPMI